MGIDNDYINEVGRAYWTEDDEMKSGNHSAQVKERIEKCLSSEIGEDFGEITFLDWVFRGSRVGVYLNLEFYGVFNYDRNEFEK